AGPFAIQDLSSSVRGKLDVKVEEQDGSVSTFQVDTASIPYLTRPGYVRYNVALGKPSAYDHRTQGPVFSAGDFSWGLSNAWSLYGGALLGGDYNA
ncbi:fimbria/pilus outer membrane usher protein, partial [Pseudomonas aeruginosa]